MKKRCNALLRWKWHKTGFVVVWLHFWLYASLEFRSIIELKNINKGKCFFCYLLNVWIRPHTHLLPWHTFIPLIGNKNQWWDFVNNLWHINVITHSTEKQPFLQTVKFITQYFNLESHVVKSAAILSPLLPKEPGTLHVINSYFSTCPVILLSINATSKHAKDVVSSKGAFHRTCWTRLRSSTACHNFPVYCIKQNPASGKRTTEVYVFVSTDLSEPPSKGEYFHSCSYLTYR